MNGKIQVLNIDIDDCTAKEAMKQTVAYMGTEAINVIEMVTVDTLMYASGDSFPARKYREDRPRDPR